MIDPIAFSLFGIDIYWYGIFYGKSFIWIYYNYKKFAPYFGISGIKFDHYLNISSIYMLVFARIFEVVFFNFDFYISNPSEILNIRAGGLSFHGGLGGIFLYTYYFCKKNNINIWLFCDFLSCFCPICIFLIRIGNFINGELIGNKCSISWYSIYIDGSLRHPSQIYEAIFEGLLIFIIIQIIFMSYVSSYKKRLLNFLIINNLNLPNSLNLYINNYFRPNLYFSKNIFNLNISFFYGFFTKSFCYLYSISRFICEYFRYTESKFKILSNFYLTQGQIFSFLILSVLIFFRKKVFFIKFLKNKPI